VAESRKFCAAPAARADDDPHGPIKTFPRRAIKDSLPYLHDGRLLTLDDTIEFFSLILELKLRQPEKADLLAFLRVL